MSDGNHSDRFLCNVANSFPVQTVKLASPISSGLYTLPLVLSLVLSSIFSGIITQRMGYYVPSMLIAPAIMSVGEGLMTTFNRDTPTSQWVGYQFLAGFGLGFGMQASGLAIQTVLPKEDVSIGIAVNFFLQQLGGAISTSIGQTILSNILGAQLAKIPNVDKNLVVSEGATHLVEIVPAEFRNLVIDGYNHACQRIFLAGTCMAFAALLCALGMEWKSIKEGENGQGPPDEDGPGGPSGPGGPNGAIGPGGPPAASSAVDMTMSRDGRPSMAEPRKSNVSNMPRSAGFDSSSHNSTGVIAANDPTGSQYNLNQMPTGFESNNPYNTSAINAQVVYMNAPFSNDPNNPYGAVAMPTPMMYANSPYNSGVIPVPVMYVNPTYAAMPPGQGVDDNGNQICNNCRCSIQAIQGVPAPMPVAASSSTSLSIPRDEKKDGGRSRSGSTSDGQ